ncbi:MAG: helix-turn-helix transcriptional regulator [Flavipsychrobacter sp.]
MSGEQEYMQLIGKRIRQVRKLRGYSSQESFAYEHDISRTQYGRYERGEGLHVSSLIKLVRIFDMTLAEFFSEGFE